MKPTSVIVHTVGMAAVLVLAGCATPSGKGEGPEAGARLSQEVSPAHDAAPRAEASASLAGKPAEGPQNVRTSEFPKRPEARVYKGTDQLVKLPVAAAGPDLSGEPVSLQFEQATVTEVVHAVLGDILGLDYVLHQPIAGDVTLHTRAPIPRDQVLPVLEPVLRARGILMVQDAHGIYHVGRPEAIKSVAPVVRSPGALPAGESVVVVPLKFIGAAEMADILRPLATPEAFMRVDNLRNLLVLSGSRTQIEGWMDIVGIFDVDMLKGMSVALFPLRYISVDVVNAALKLISPGASAGGGKPGELSAGAAPTTVGPLGGALRILPIERLNAVLVITPRAAYLDEAREWIERLDREGGGDDGPSLFIYPVQNGSATHLASLLTSLFGGGGATTSVAEARDSGVAPGLTAATGAAAGTALSAGMTPTGTGAGYSATPTSVTGTAFGRSRKTAASKQQDVAVALGDQVRVVADSYQNALIIYAPRTEYNKIEAALRRLDVAAAQVLIEASIIEVTLTDDLQYGLQWFFNDNVKGRGWTGTGALTTSASGTIASGGSGFTYTVSNPLGGIAAKLNALADKSLIKVISSPSLMVLDNQTAEIQVGTQQPVKTISTAATTTGVTTESIEYKDTGVQLSVTPSINAGDMITMDLEQRVTDVGDQDVATGQRSFLQRSITSKVAVRSGETIVLGGLIKNNNSSGRQGVPVLQDIPLLGHLFGTTTVNKDRTELIVMITPRVVRTETDVSDVGQEMRQKMRMLDHYREELSR